MSPTEEVPPAYLWHYTSWRGMEGIFREHQLWASQLGWLNDTQELEHAERVIKLALLRSIGRTRRSTLKGDVEDIIYRLQHSRLPVFGASFSAVSDSLSQWRAYGAPVGFAIGFESLALRSLLAQSVPRFRLCACGYSYPEQRAKLSDLIAPVHEFLRLKKDWDLHCLTVPNTAEGHAEARRTYEPVNTAMETVCEQFAERSGELKHPAFREEQEWRVVARPVNAQNFSGYRASGSTVVPRLNVGLGFHAHNSMVVPHLGLDLGPRSQSPIRRVVVGPSPHPLQLKQSIMLLAGQHSLEVKVSNSRVPYRNW